MNTEPSPTMEEKVVTKEGPVSKGEELGTRGASREDMDQMKNAELVGHLSRKKVDLISGMKGSLY